jgi:hypothetical protein
MNLKNTAVLKDLESIISRKMVILMMMIFSDFLFMTFSNLIQSSFGQVRETFVYQKLRKESANGVVFCKLLMI